MKHPVRLCAILLALGVGTARAEPFALPGDIGLRHDLQLLADAGIVRGPVTTWPLSWPDIASDVGDVREVPRNASLAEALARVQARARLASQNGAEPLGLRVAAAKDPDAVRGFAALPREEGELEARTGWMSDHLAVRLVATAVSDPDDGRELRADGSYLGVNVGNVVLSAGYIDRWWGPGWDGSLILSTNARPIPAVTLERNVSEPFKTRWLSWLGHWRASLTIGQTEDAGLEVPNTRFLAARVNARPVSWLEFGLSRTAQWCGGERECSAQVLRDLLIGRDNRDPSAPDNDEPGNQMAGYDLRIRSPWRALPLAAYTQWIGEDEAGGLPSKFLGLAGLETWADTGLGSLRAHLEFADTTCMFTRENPAFNCAYRNSLYPQGYTHRGRVIGHGLDNDGRMLSMGVVLAQPGDSVFQLQIRRIELNRDGGPHTISTAPADLEDVELRHFRGLGIGRVGVTLGYSRARGTSALDTGVRGSLVWQQGF